MKNGSAIAVIIPALNEERSIGRVLAAIPEWVDEVVVVDNGSTDGTAEVARAGGARVIWEPRRGYGSACLTGITALRKPDVVVFLDGDFSDDPGEMDALVDPILQDRADMVIGSRTRGHREPGALTPQARFGNWLACTLIRFFWKVSCTDLGPFRAIRFSALQSLGMRDRDYGWTVEMQIKAARRGIRVLDVPVSYRRRIGKSKVSGTVRGVIGAGTKILYTIFRAALTRPTGESRSGEPEGLVVFTRYPEPGKAKKRLIPALGPEGAARLQRQMTEHTLAQVRRLAQGRSVSVCVYFEGGNERQMIDWLGPQLPLHPQEGEDLGARMAGAFREAFQKGLRRVVIVGTDCPALTAEHIQEALKLLAETDLVLGPARDGGYYLIGLRRMIPQLFQDIAWGTGEVLEKTLEIARQLGLSVSRLETLQDVDRPEDLSVWEREVGRSETVPDNPYLTVIIPTLNEADYIEAAVRRVRTAPDVEVIVADGGSQDGTVQLATAQGARVVTAPPGRARQMNTAAALAKGDVLLFLHADTRVPENYDQHIYETLRRPSVIAGAFRFHLDASSLSLRLIEVATRWRGRWLQMPYGDQGIFVKAKVFHEVGGFPDLPIMEDFEMVRRLRRKGRVVITSAAATISARRWLRVGPLRASLFNQVVILSYLLGIPPERIAHWYHRLGHREVKAEH